MERGSIHTYCLLLSVPIYYSSSTLKKKGGREVITDEINEDIILDESFGLNLSTSSSHKHNIHIHASVHSVHYLAQTINATKMN